MQSFSTIDVWSACYLGKNQKIIKSLELLLELFTRMFRMYKFCLSERVYHIRPIKVNHPRMAWHRDDLSSLQSPTSFSSLSTESWRPKNSLFAFVVPGKILALISLQIGSPYSTKLTHLRDGIVFTLSLENNLLEDYSCLRLFDSIWCKIKFVDMSHFSTYETCGCWVCQELCL